MSVHYKTVQKKGKLAEQASWHAVVVNQGEISLQELGRRIANSCHLSASEVTAIMEALLIAIPQALAEGKIVRLGELGTFQLYARSKGAVQKESFGRKNILAPTLHFRPGKELKQAISLFEWKKI